MKNSLLQKFQNILNNVYSSKIPHSLEIQKELNELSNILEKPIDNLISAMSKDESDQNNMQINKLSRNFK